MRQYLEELKEEARAEGEAHARQYLEELKAEVDANRIKETDNNLKKLIELGKIHLDMSEEEFYSFVRDGGEPETV